MVRKLCIALIFVLITTVRTSSAADETPPGSEAYLQTLIRRSVEKGSSEKRLWHLLLHYRKGFWGGTVSDADGPEFFLSPDGKTNPQKEIEATLRKFLSDEPVGLSQLPAQCAFPARYRWLKDELGFDPALLPEQGCERFRTWIRGLDPQSVTLIFPSAFMNSPSSMFGHTLLRVDQGGQTEETRLLAYAINFAATTTTENTLVAAALGMTGGFKGYFSIHPYYVKVREYSDMENRDIWEYRLNLSPDQIEWMLMHTWELGNTYFDYYFLTENCSYHLLSLIEIADPDLHLTDGG
jgi:hypothetical protein